MYEVQASVRNENLSHPCPEFMELMSMAQRELNAFMTAVTELFGSEQAKVSAEDWLDEFALSETWPGSTSRDWRSVTISAAARLARRVNASLRRTHG